MVELYRKAGAEAAVEGSLPKKKSAKGLRHGQMVETFVLLSALGGDCVEDMERLWADVAYVPSRKREQRGAPPYRYLAIRIRSQQEGWDWCAPLCRCGQRLGHGRVKWQRGKAGTIEHVHCILSFFCPSEVDWSDMN
ncbi:MAG: hypothetical protein V1724_08390 [Chloroflexota bacterium]